ncbi:MAG TPA: DMT family transporter, partial [Casimicrobiaceae bacterium]|nr:DMT family transporter [Casimicrobiaceae bacterium]
MHAAVALFGFAALFGKWIALPATAIVLGRTVVAAMTLAIVLVARDRTLGASRLGFVVNGAILAAHWVAFFEAVQIASVAVALLGYATFPLFVLVLERRRATRPASGGDTAVATLTAAGLLVLAPNFSWSSDAFRGLALGVASGFTFAWLAVRSMRLVASVSATRIAFWQNAFAAACLAPVVVLASPLPAWPTPADWALIVVLGVVCTGLAHTLFIASMQRVSAHTASIVAALEPVYGILLAVVLLRELPDVRTLLGGALIVAA